MGDFETRACPACGSDRAEEVYDQLLQPIFGVPGFQQRVQLCLECGMVYVSPAPSAELLREHYSTMSNYENPAMSGRPTDEDRRKHHRALGVIADVAAAPTPGRALDIGCAVPYLLGCLKRDGWEVLGTDPSPRVAEIGRDLYGVEVRTGLFDASAFADDQPFDLVVLSHVVEHLLAPVELLSDVRKVAPDGALYVEVPNLLDPAVPFGYFTFEHVNYFTPATLTTLLAAAGYVPISVHTFDNADGTWPSYPVISSVFRPGARPAPPASDVDAARAAVAGYRASSAREGERLRQRVETIVASVAPGRLALWGAGIHTNQLFTLTGLDPELIACIYDNDPKKDGRRLLGRPVRRPPDDPAEVAAEADAILISSRASEDVIHRQIAYLGDRGVRVHTLYRETAVRC